MYYDEAIPQISHEEKRELGRQHRDVVIETLRICLAESGLDPDRVKTTWDHVYISGKYDEMTQRAWDLTAFRINQMASA